tara:strand:+ start:3734 stop:4756 length:1023 start_codon:yes stop_codon:yes gene_type:complete
MSVKNLDEISKKMMEPGKGILAADESTGTIKKRLDTINVKSTEETRRQYREILFTTKNIEEYISGVIMFDETIDQSNSDGVSFIQVLTKKNIVPGIKVDKSTWPLEGAPEYPITEGLDGLKARCDNYAEKGLCFTKWRAVIKIVNSQTPDIVIKSNTHALARYAAIAQSSGLVPIVEPEVLMDGDHSIETCQKITKKTLTSLYDELNKFNVRIEGTILKPNMILPGTSSAEKVSPAEVAERTINTFINCVPSSVPGIAFLSGGLSEIEASTNLNEINNIGDQPWELTFSFGRALQSSTLTTWSGKNGNINKSQSVFLHRAKMNGLARAGKYSENLEKKYS